MGPRSARLQSNLPTAWWRAQRIGWIRAGRCNPETQAKLGGEGLDDLEEHHSWGREQLEPKPVTVVMATRRAAGGPSFLAVTTRALGTAAQPKHYKLRDHSDSLSDNNESAQANEFINHSPGNAMAKRCGFALFKSPCVIRQNFIIQNKNYPGPLLHQRDTWKDKEVFRLSRLRGEGGAISKYCKYLSD